MSESDLRNKVETLPHKMVDRKFCSSKISNFRFSVALVDEKKNSKYNLKSFPPVATDQLSNPIKNA